MLEEAYNSNKQRIFIFAPAGIVTGGVELLHQLCDVYNKNGKDAYVVYYGNEPKEIPNDYKKYNIKQCDSSEILDNENNIIVVPEVRLGLLNNFKCIKAIVWWMSVDNYYSALQANCFSSFNYYWRIDRLKALGNFLRKIFRRHYYPTYTLSKLRNNKNVIFNVYQSEYAKSFLVKHKIQNTAPLSDYINQEYFFSEDNFFEKEDSILYNPKKGLRFTKQLIKMAPELHWVPIQNMTRAQVKETMLKSKLYIDFGHFPGKDRMPREAAMCGCCIITGKLGAAGFKEDLDIDESKYKFNQTKRDIPKILQSVRNILENYTTAINDFSYYREKIIREKNEFEHDAMIILKILNYTGGGYKCKVVSPIYADPSTMCA